MNTTENWITVANRDAVEPGGVIGVKAGELDVALYNIDGKIYATHKHLHACACTSQRRMARE